jgi:signal transduction histidine kinase
MSRQAARVRFRIAAPVWQRWWFLLAAAAAAAGLAYGAHRTILDRRLAVERTRARIATDLHDDIGSSLARISVLSEVLKSTVRPPPDGARLIDQIATSARDLIESLNDIVWSIDPRLDSLSDVVARIRRYASDVLDPGSIEWTFEAPSEAGRVNLSPEQRRHLLLIFKEAIHNIVRHSACRRASFRILLENGHFEASIADDGRGIPAENQGGRGLASMRLRASQLGGRLDVVSNPEGGTELRLRFPVG